VAGIILYASVRTIVPVERPLLPHLDKILHAGAYGLLTLTLARALGGRSGWRAAAIATAYGLALEGLQHFIGRTPSLVDGAANAAGAVAAAWVWALWEKRPRGS
jgi:VanZ family protein